MSYMDIKHCIKCKQPFDIGTNYELCPGCRYRVIKSEVKEDGEEIK